MALLVAVIVGIVNLASGPGSPSTTSTTHTTTTTTVPATSLGIGMRTVSWTDNDPDAGQAVTPGGSARARLLDTEIWYPALGGSRSVPTARLKPDYAGGPFPLVVFAHGFDTLPTTYTALISSLVDAGFVVAAPLFPDENADEISALGIADSTQQLGVAESDVVNEPYDVAWVVTEVESGAQGSAASGAPWLKGLVEPGKYALVGHSDGAQAVAALVYSSAGSYASVFAGLPARPFAVVILSGSELGGGTYAAPSEPPTLLFVQSAVDQCNLPSYAATLFHDAGGGFFLKLLGAGHFAPYVGRGPAAPVVEKVVGAFLKAAVASTPTEAQLAQYVTGTHQAVLYAPDETPVLASVPTPTSAQQSAACAPPSGS